MKVSELMTRDVRACRPESTMEEAARILWEHDCGSVPVVDETRRVCGMLTDRDVTMAAYLQGRRLAEMRVADAMAERVRSCRETDTLEEVRKAMSEEQLHRLPVVDPDGALVGMLSVADMIRAVDLPGGRRKRTPAEEIVETLASISKPRLAGTREVPAAKRPVLLVP